MARIVKLASLLSILALLPACGSSSSTVTFPATYSGTLTVKFTVMANYGARGSCTASKDYDMEMTLHEDGSANFKGTYWSSEFIFSSTGTCDSVLMLSRDSYDITVGDVHDGKGKVWWKEEVNFGGTLWRKFDIMGAYNSATLEAGGSVSGEAITASGKSYQQTFEHIIALKGRAKL